MGSQKLVVVVGAGLAGLAAAREAQSNGFEVLVLEAADVLGGRIKQIAGLVPWPVEAGPEFLHGKQNSSILQIATEIGCEMRELRYPDYYYIGSENSLITAEAAEDHPDIEMVHGIFASLADAEIPSPDIGMDEFMRRMNVNDTVIQLAESIYSNDFGCSLHELGVGECIEEAKQWVYGDTYMILDRPLSCIVEHLSKGLNVLRNHPVEEIAYSMNRGVELKCRGSDEKIEADYAIVTVPVKILTSEIIRFNPPLPKAKLDAVSSIGMSNVLKILLAFSETFWPEEMFDVVCTDCFIPEFWSTKYPCESGGNEDSKPLGKVLLVGFIAGEAAVKASKLSHDKIISRALSQLDNIFGKKTSSTKNTIRPEQSFQESGSGFFIRSAAETAAESLDRGVSPASFCFAGATVVDWSREEFIRGGYTHPSLNARGAREEVARPIDGRVFFAGEATHSGVNPCMQAAIDTGRCAAQQVFKSCVN